MYKSLVLATFVVSAFVLVGCTPKPAADVANPTVEVEVEAPAPKPVVEAPKPATATGTANTATGAAAAEVDAVKLAACLKEKGWTMYGTERCPHCANQKKAFGDAFSADIYVDCDKEAETCKTEGITGYPTWKNKEGQAFPGSQQLANLAQLSECN
jgi:hypothetical protein